MAKQNKKSAKKSAKKGSKGSVTKGALKKSAKTVAKKKVAAKSPPKKKAARKTKRKPETLMCFLTTACVNYYALPDNGYELNTLRNYRDTYLASTAAGKKLIQDYYSVSPKIVKRIEKDLEKKSVYAYIFSEVKTACSEIENRRLLSAKKIYSTMVRTLMKKYALKLDSTLPHYD